MVPEIFAFLGTDTARPDFEIITCTKNAQKSFKMRKMTNVITPVDMILIVFVGSNTPFGVLLTRISWPQDPYSKKAPPFQPTAAFLAIFDKIFTYRGPNIHI